MYEKRLVLHDHDKSLLSQPRNSPFEVVSPIPDCFPARSVDVYFLCHFGGQVVQMHDLPDVRDVDARAGLLPYVLLQIHLGLSWFVTVENG